MADPILFAARGAVRSELLPALANRHGLITGATGTGKTVSLQTLAEGFSRLGVPVVLADVKGDLTGISQPGTLSPKMLQTLADRGLGAPTPAAVPVQLWDVHGERGHPVRATVSDMGPLLLARMLSLNETQAGVLAVVFRIADDQGLGLLDLKDLRAMVAHVGDRAKEFTTRYGNVSTASIGAIQRALLQLESQGAEHFFGEPMLDVADLLVTATAPGTSAAGMVNVLVADRLLDAPRLYASFLLWLLSEFYERLPEIGDPDRPRLVFFFDEAHLLFTEAPPALLERIELVVRLVRSKGVGVWFVTQNPLDVPDRVLGQLGNRVQHALRAFTPRDQKAVAAAAETMRPNPAVGDLGNAIGELAVGEALVSFLDAGGRPMPTQRVYVMPPGSRLGPITDAERASLREGSPVHGRYETTVDRESAYEILRDGLAGAPRVAAAPGPAPGNADTTVAGAVTPSAATSPAAAVPPGGGIGGIPFGMSATAPATMAATAPAVAPTGATRPMAVPPLASPRAPAAPTGTTAAAPVTGALDGLRDAVFGRTGPRGGHYPGLVEAAATSAVRSIGSSVGREIMRGVLGGIFGGRRR